VFENLPNRINNVIRPSAQSDNRPEVMMPFNIRPKKSLTLMEERVNLMRELLDEIYNIMEIDYF
jgi:hypothetical protein